MNRIPLFSPLPPAECVSRLEAAIDSETSAIHSVGGPPGSRPVIGRIGGTSLRLYKRLKGRNSFQSFLTATLRPEAGGTAISGEVGMHPAVGVFMWIWFGLTILIGGPLLAFAVWTMISDSASQTPITGIGFAFLPIMLATGIGLVFFGAVLARDEARFLSDFLTQTLNARAQDRPA